MTRHSDGIRAVYIGINCYNDLMKYKIIIPLVIVVVAILGIILWPKEDATVPVEKQKNIVSPPYKNATYTIDGKTITLVDGYSEVGIAPGSASKLVTRYFGNAAEGDLNGDGKPDIAFLLTQTGGGSGTFYYVVAALKTDAGYKGTNGILLGDRIAPQTTEIRDGTIVVNYADRKKGDPMTAQPSVGVSKYFGISNGHGIPVGELFELLPGV